MPPPRNHPRACLEYVEGLRWPEGFVCVGCGGLGEVWRASRGRLVCPHCRRQTSVLAGTVFHRTRSPLRLWFLAAWELTSQKYGANALGLQRVLGLGSYKTAWAALCKWTRAMSGAWRLECGAARRSRRPSSRSPPRSTDARSGEYGCVGCPTSPLRFCEASSRMMVSR